MLLLVFLGQFLIAQKQQILVLPIEEIEITNRNQNEIIPLLHNSERSDDELTSTSDSTVSNLEV